MNLLYYLAEANLYLGVFYLAYCLLLTKETHYQLNRAYLLFSCMAGFVLPVLQIGVLKPVQAVVNTTINYAVPEYTEPLPVDSYINTKPVIVEHHLTLQDYLVYVYLLGACFVLVLLMVKLFNLFKLMRNAQTVDHLKYKVVYLPESGVAFSFFNYLFIGNNAPGVNTIVRHELVHIRQKHSFDIVFLELLKVVSWFNPFVYLLQNSLKTVHEYIADEQTAAYEADTLAYSTFLVNNAYGMGGSSITHSFFNYNLLKKRIIMLHQQRSGSLARLKYLVAIPVCVASLFTSTLAFSKTYGWIDLDPARSIEKKPASPQTAQKKFILPASHKNKQGGNVFDVKLSNIALPLVNNRDKHPHPLIIVDGKKYEFSSSEKGMIAAGMNIITTADSTTTYPADNQYAISKWGKDAEAGVIMISGNASVKIQNSTEQKTGMVKFPPPVVTPNTDKFLTWDFITYLQNTIKFPNYPLDDSFVLTLKTSFVVANNKITDITMVKESDNKVAYTKKPKDVNLSDNELKSFQTEIIKAIQNAPTDNIAPGNYSLPIAFLFSNDNKEVLVVQNRVMVRSETGGMGILSIPVITAVKKLSDNDKTPAQSDLESLGKYFSQHILYPAVDRKNGTAGRVITLFAVDANHNLQYAKVVRTPSELMGAEVLRVLKACTEFSMLKPGVQYVIPIAYTINDDNGNNIGSQPTIGVSPKLSNPDALIYNPNNIDIPINPPGSLMLNEIVIRGYVRQN